MRQIISVLALALSSAGGFTLQAQTSTPLVCQANSGITPFVRASGITELLGDIVISCVGGSGTVTTTISVALTAPGTHRVGEAILMLDEPTSFTPGVNLFQAIPAPDKTLTFPPITFAAPGANGMRVLRIANLRADASAVPPSGSAVPAAIEAFISASPAGSLPLDRPRQVVGIIRPDLQSEMVLPGSGTPPSMCSGHNAGLVSNPLATGGVIDFAMQFTEGFATAFRPRYEATVQATAGASYFGESGYFDTRLPGTYNANRLGFADSGTKLVLRFSGIPAGMRLYASVAPVDPTSAQLVRVAADGSLVPTATSAMWNGKLVAVAPVENDLAEWVVQGASASQIESFRFGVLMAYSGALPTGALPQVTAVLGPSFNLHVPRFAETSTPVYLPLSSCGGGVDLVPTGLSDLPVRSRQVAGTKFTVANRGSAASGAFAYRVTVLQQLAGGGTFEHGRVEGTTASLEPGASRTITVRLRPPPVPISNTLRVEVVVDSGSAVADSNRSNNTLSSAWYPVDCDLALAGNIAAAQPGGSQYPPVISGACSVPAPLAMYQEDGSPFPGSKWLTITSSGISIDANTTALPRTALGWHDRYGFFQVQQSVADNCAFQVTGSLSTAPPEGTSRTWNVATNPGCRWSAVANTRFAAPSGEVFTGSGELLLKIRPNFASAARNITVAVANQTLTVAQAGNPRPQAQRIIQLIYYYFLGRLPSDAEIALQTAAMAGMDLEDFLPRFFNTPEFDANSRYVAGLYVGLLSRDAEFNGFIYQRDALLTNRVTHKQLVSNFLGALEWQLRFGTPSNAEFVRILYTNVLLRTPTQAEVDWHAANLTAGQSRVDLASNFLNSGEFRAGTGPRLTAFLLFATALGRDAVAPDLQSAINRLKQGMSANDLLAELVGSMEFAGIID